MAFSLGHFVTGLSMAGAGALRGDLERKERERKEQLEDERLRLLEEERMQRWADAMRGRGEERRRAGNDRRRLELEEARTESNLRTADEEAERERIRFEERNQVSPTEQAYIGQQDRLERERRREEQMADLRGRAGLLAGRSSGNEGLVRSSLGGFGNDLAPGEVEQIITEVVQEYRARPQPYEIVSPDYQGKEAVGTIIMLAPEEAQAAAGMVKPVAPKAAPPAAKPPVQGRALPMPADIPRYDTIQDVFAGNPEPAPLGSATLEAIRRATQSLQQPTPSDYRPRR